MIVGTIYSNPAGIEISVLRTTVLTYWHSSFLLNFLLSFSIVSLLYKPMLSPLWLQSHILHNCALILTFFLSCIRSFRSFFFCCIFLYLLLLLLSCGAVNSLTQLYSHIRNVYLSVSAFFLSWLCSFFFPLDFLLHMSLMLPSTIEPLFASHTQLRKHAYRGDAWQWGMYHKKNLRTVVRSCDQCYRVIYRVVPAHREIMLFIGKPKGRSKMISNGLIETTEMTQPACF